MLLWATSDSYLFRLKGPSYYEVECCLAEYKVTKDSYSYHLPLCHHINFIISIKDWPLHVPSWGKNTMFNNQQFILCTPLKQVTVMYRFIHLKEGSVQLENISVLHVYKCRMNPVYYPVLWSVWVLKIYHEFGSISFISCFSSITNRGISPNMR